MAGHSALESSGNKLAGDNALPIKRRRVEGGRRRAGIGGQCPAFLGTEPKAHSANSSAAQGSLVTPRAAIAPGAGSGGAGHGPQLNLAMAHGGRQADARFRVFVFAQSAKLLGSAAGSRQVDFAKAGLGDANAVGTGVNTAMVAPNDLS